MLAYTNLGYILKMNMTLKTISGMQWSLDEFDNMTPFERDAYILMTSEFLKKRAEEMKKKG